MRKPSRKTSNPQSPCTMCCNRPLDGSMVAFEYEVPYDGIRVHVEDRAWLRQKNVVVCEGCATMLAEALGFVPAGDPSELEQQLARAVTELEAQRAAKVDMAEHANRLEELLASRPVFAADAGPADEPEVDPLAAAVDESLGMLGKDRADLMFLLDAGTPMHMALLILSGGESRSEAAGTAPEAETSPAQPAAAPEAATVPAAQPAKPAGPGRRQRPRDKARAAASQAKDGK